MSRTLYLSYDGMTDPLGQSQVLPYVVSLARRGYGIELISFEKPARSAAVAPVRALLEKEGIRWHPLRYTKRPPILSTAFDLLRLRALATQLHRREPFQLVHCRSYIPAIAGASLRRFGAKLLFDMRGFWPDEKVEGGSWLLSRLPYRLVYRFFKRKERELLRAADAVVTLTRRGMEVVEHSIAGRDSKPIRQVIPCSVDYELFSLPSPEAKARARTELEIPNDARVFTYLGSLGTWYLLGEMLDFFAEARRRDPHSRFLLLTPDLPDAIFAAADARGIPANRLTVRSASREEVVRLLPASDFGIFFIRPTPSKTGSSPTKLGEFLAMGIPVVTNAGIGDVDADLHEIGAGLTVDRFTADAYQEVLDRLHVLKDVSPCTIRSRSREIFELQSAVKRYAHVYAELLGSPSAPTA